MNINIDDLSFDLLKYIMEFLSLKQLFIVESVSKKWQKCARKTMQQIKSLEKLKHISDEFHYGIDHNNIDIFNCIATKCPNIKQLDLSSTKLTGDNIFVSIAKLCPKLESIDFSCSWIKANKHDIEEFGKLIGPQLIKCHFGLRSFDHGFMMVFCKYLKNIEEITFQLLSNEETVQLFHHLNSKCKNLKMVRWRAFNFNLIEKHIQLKNQDIIDVIHRIDRLMTCLSVLSRFRFPINNLTELTIAGCRSNTTKVEMIFPNLTKLNINDFTDENFDLISKYKFPKLESVSLKGIPNAIPLSFINQIQNIKSLQYEHGFDWSSLIGWLTNLTEFMLTICDVTNSQLFELINSLSKHNSLENINLKIADYEMTIDDIFYDNLSSLYYAKPNTLITIEIVNKDNEKCIEYKRIFDEAKHLNKLNLKLLYLGNC